MPNLRYVVGPQFDSPVVKLGGGDGLVAPQGRPVTAVSTKLDVAVKIVAVDQVAWTVAVAVPAYDLATYNRLVEVRAYLVPETEPRPIASLSGQDFADSAFAVSIENVSIFQGGANALINLPEVETGRYVGQIVLGFEIDPA